MRGLEYSPTSCPRDQPAPACTIQHKCCSAGRRSLDRESAVLDVHTGVESSLLENWFEAVGRDLPTQSSLGKCLDASCFGTPPDGVAGRSRKSRSIDRVSNPQEIEQFARGGRDGFRKL